MEQMSIEKEKPVIADNALQTTDGCGNPAVHAYSVTQPPFTIKPYRCEQCNAEIYVRHDAHATDIKVACGACHRPRRKTIEDDDDNHRYAQEDCTCTGRCADKDGDCTS